MSINKQLGVDYETPEDNNKAQKVDLITMPPNISGVNCSNCQFFDKKLKQGKLESGICDHPEIKLPVTGRMCCSKWNAFGTLRSFEK